jgi:hypothetical protein
MRIKKSRNDVLLTDLLSTLFQAGHSALEPIVVEFPNNDPQPVFFAFLPTERTTQ